MDKNDITLIIESMTVIIVLVVLAFITIFVSNNFNVEDAVKEDNKLKLEFYKETGITYYKEYSEWLENKLNKGK